MKTNKENLNFSKIKTIELSNFLNFNDLNIKFASGINLFIGQNNIGKTGFLKFIYANTKASEEYFVQKNTSAERTFKEILSIKMQKTFQSDDKIGGIVCKFNNEELKNNLFFENQINEIRNIIFSFKKTTQKQITNLEFTDFEKQNNKLEFNTIFIPTKEILSISKTIEIICKQFKTEEFDDTYSDIVEDIKPFFVKNINPDFEEIVANFKNNILEGEIEYDKNKNKYFYKDNKGFKFDLSITAEGIKQLGIIPLLIKTGKLKQGTILFLDEPDNNLNPEIIIKYTDILFKLANLGVQIFITTHNHLFSQYISLLTEYKPFEKNPECKFFALFKDTNNKTSIETGNDLLDIQHNLMLDEYVKLADIEQEFILKSKNSKNDRI